MRRYLIDENISPEYRTQLLYHEPSLTVLVIGDEGAPVRSTSDPEILVWCQLPKSKDLGLYDVLPVPLYKLNSFLQ